MMCDWGIATKNISKGFFCIKEEILKCFVLVNAEYEAQ